MIPLVPAPNKWPLFTGLVHRPFVTGISLYTVLTVPSLFNLTRAPLGFPPAGLNPVLPHTDPFEKA